MLHDTDIADLRRPVRRQKLAEKQEFYKIKIRQTCRQFMQTDRLTDRHFQSDNQPEMLQIKGVTLYMCFVSWAASG